MFWGAPYYERDRPIKVVVGNFDSNSDPPPGTVIESDYCRHCSIKLVSRKADGAKFCPQCGWLRDGDRQNKNNTSISPKNMSKAAGLNNIGEGFVVAMPDSRNRPMDKRYQDINSTISDDPDIARLQNRGATIISSETYLPQQGVNVAETYNSEDELRRFQKK